MFDRFCVAFAEANPNEFPLMLVDSEAPVKSGKWGHLQVRDGWKRPDNASEDHAHLMVQCMEAWFLADHESLSRFFGPGFRENALPGNPDVEEISKRSLFESLKMATKDCRTKGEYGQGKHSFEILGELDPKKVTLASPHAADLLNTLEQKCDS